MKCFPIRITSVVVCVVVAMCLGLSMVMGQAKSQSTGLADKLVNTCAGVRSGDVVLVTGGVRDAALLDDIALQCRKLGAFPIVTLASEIRERRYYDDVPDSRDSQMSKADLLLANNIDVLINVTYGENPTIFEGIPATRAVTLEEVGNKLADIRLRRNVREVYLGNNIYPTQMTAQQNGISQDELAALFWTGVNVDYDKLHSIGETVRATLAAGDKIHITGQNGTDLSFRIRGQLVLASDGVIGKQDAVSGGPACQVFLPAGEVYLAPIRGTAEGKVVVDRQIFRGREIRDLTMTFKGGRLIDMTATSGLEPFKAVYDAASAGKEELSFIDIGVNPNIVLPVGSDLDAWMATGMVTVGLGSNYWSGGDNRSSFSSAHFLHGVTVTVDDKKLVEHGSLAL